MCKFLQFAFIFTVFGSVIGQSNPSTDSDWANLIITSGPRSYVLLASLKSNADQVPPNFLLGHPLNNGSLTQNVDNLHSQVGLYFAESLALTRRMENELKLVYQIFYFMSMSCQQGLLKTTSIGQVLNVTAIAELKRNPSYWEGLMTPMTSVLRSAQLFSEMISLSVKSSTYINQPNARVLVVFNNTLQEFSRIFFAPNLQLLAKILEKVQAAERDATQLRMDTSIAADGDSAFCTRLSDRMVAVEDLYAQVYFFVRSRNEVMNHYVLSQMTPSEFREAPLHDQPNPEQTEQGMTTWLETVAVPGAKAIVEHRQQGLAKWRTDTVSNKLSKCFDMYLG